MVRECGGVRGTPPSPGLHITANNHSQNNRMELQIDSDDNIITNNAHRCLLNDALTIIYNHPVARNNDNLYDINYFIRHSSMR